MKKKTFYKRWWFITLAAIIVIIIVQEATKDKTQENKTEQSTPKIKTLLEQTEIKSLMSGTGNNVIGHYANIVTAPELYTAEEFHAELEKVFDKYKDGDKKINYAVVKNLDNGKDLHILNPELINMGTFTEKDGITNSTPYIYKDGKYGELDIFRK